MAEYRRDSLYRNTDIENKQYLGIWEPTVTEISSLTTQPYTIENKYHQRPDTVADMLYGNAKLWWVFATINQDILNDPITDFEAGLTIQVPLRFT